MPIASVDAVDEDDRLTDQRPSTRSQQRRRQRESPTLTGSRATAAGIEAADRSDPVDVHVTDARATDHASCSTGVATVRRGWPAT
jgi:hypothetical protein